MLAKQIDWRLGGLAQKVKGAGEKYRDGAGIRHRLHRGFRHVLQMIGAQCTMASGQGRPTLVRQLLRVQLDRQRMVRRRFEHPFGLRQGETDTLAEAIHRVGKAGFGRRRQRLRADEIGIRIGTPRELGRQRVGAEECGDDIHSGILAHASRGSQLTQLGVHIEPVARLDFDGGDAFGEQRLESCLGERDELLLARLSSGPHRRHDAAATTRDFRVAHPFETLLELPGSAARPTPDGCGSPLARG